MAPVYLVDFSVYKPPEEYRVVRTECEEYGKNWSFYSEDKKEFMLKVYKKSGLSPTGTFLPPAIHPKLTPEPCNDIPNALKEAEMVMGGAVADLLEKARVLPSEIDILVTNCSIFCPTPSLASMLVNKFKFRSDIQAYNLGGMGCGNGVMAINLLRDLLQARPNARALFVPAEITTYCFYPGDEKKFMVANCIFRMGGAAILLSNRAADRAVAKYTLQQAVRVHTGQDDASYRCMSWSPDAEGQLGVYLGRDIVSHAGKALRMCMEKVTPGILTWDQVASAALHTLKRAALGGGDEWVPDYTRCVQHFAIHAGGYAVLQGIRAGLKLPADKVLPSFAALREYGNTSCSTTWYVLAYMETCGVVRKGELVMQVGMGGGMKAGVNIWRALRDNKSLHRTWMHLAHSPLTPADLPRAIDESEGLNDAAAAATSSAEAPAATPAAEQLVKPQQAGSVVRKPTVEVVAVADE